MKLEEGKDSSEHTTASLYRCKFNGKKDGILKDWMIPERMQGT